MNKCIFILAGNTAREIARQSTFYFIIGGGAVLILFSFFFTLFAFGEETRMIKEMGVSTITVCSLCLASLSATSTISKEIEKGTLVTLLSKNVSKISILFGKFLGIVIIVLLTFAMLGVPLAVSAWLKDTIDHHTRLSESFFGVLYSIAAPLSLSFLQIVMICAIAIAGSLCLPMISNLSCCMFIFIMGDLLSFFQYLFSGKEGWVLWLVAFFYTLFPNPEVFNAVSMGNIFGTSILGRAALLAADAVVYVAFVLTVAFEIFDNKECK
ncbi:MAG TPA: hypothetical protein ACFYEC_00940 [Candidatus Brocadiaceae bacterium]